MTRRSLFAKIAALVVAPLVKATPVDPLPSELAMALARSASLTYAQIWEDIYNNGFTYGTGTITMDDFRKEQWNLREKSHAEPNS